MCRRLARQLGWLVLAAQLCMGALLGQVPPRGPSLSSNFTAKEPLWKQFPILMVNLTPETIDDVDHLIDVALYYTTFAAFDDDLDAFRFDAQALPMLEAAAELDVAVAITLSPFAAASLATAEDPDPSLLGDGTREWMGDQYALFDPSGSVRIPIGPHDKDTITPEFIEYWAAKLPAFFDAVTGSSAAHALYAWYGIDEIRWWRPEQDYGLAVALRDAVGTHAPASGRPILAYTPPHYGSLDLARTLLQTPTSDSPTSPLNVYLAPIAPKSFGYESGETVSLFPRWERFGRDEAFQLQPIQQHVIQGAYVGRMIGAYGHVNRLVVLHRADVATEAVGIARVAHHTNHEDAPNNLAISGPDLDALSLALSQPTPAEARHDFWASVMRGQGLFLFNYQHKVMAESVVPPTEASQILLDVWAEYETGLGLIQNTLRPYLVNGLRSIPDIEILSNAAEVISGTDYLDSGHPELQRPWLVLPDYSAVNGLVLRQGNIAYMIVTNSYAQRVEFAVDFSDPICSAAEVTGRSGSLEIRDRRLFDRFSGIDGAVYRIEFARAPLGSCDFAFRKSMSARQLDRRHAR